MRRFPPRPLPGAGDPDLIARHAWAKLAKGVSLKDCAWHVRLSVAEMDKIIWAWRCKAVRQTTPAEQREQALALRKFG